MQKKIINSILIVSIVLVGFARHYLFFNAHYAGLYIKKMYTQSKTDSWLQFMDQMTLTEVEQLKWTFTVITLLVVFLITLVFIQYNFKTKKGTFYLFGGIFLFSSLLYFLHLVGLPYTFQISRRGLHFLQSPLPLMLLYLYYKFLHGNNWHTNI